MLFYLGCYIEEMAATSQTKRFCGQNDTFGASLRRRGEFFFIFFITFSISNDKHTREYSSSKWAKILKLPPSLQVLFVISGISK